MVMCSISSSSLAVLGKLPTVIWILEHLERTEAMGASGRREMQGVYLTERYIEGYRSLFHLALEGN